MDLTTLTPKEKEVLACLLKGNSNNAIAQRMNISINTVKTHLKNIFQKMGVSSRQELIINALA